MIKPNFHVYKRRMTYLVVSKFDANIFFPSYAMLHQHLQTILWCACNKASKDGVKRKIRIVFFTESALLIVNIKIVILPLRIIIAMHKKGGKKVLIIMRGIIKMKKKIEMMIENYPINICLIIQFYDHEWGQCPLKYYGMTSGPRLYLHNQQNHFRL